MMKVGKMDSLTRRRLQPEIMDCPDLGAARHWHALRGLARINWLSGSAGILWPSIRQLAKEATSRPLRILDVACGGGDVSIALYRRVAQAGLNVQIEAADISSNALTYARRQGPEASDLLESPRRSADNQPDEVLTTVVGKPGRVTGGEMKTRAPGR